ncbi:probable inactive purple acid phosphatase 24 [Zea mays]|uniref:probable inactive purple acid phosphatase 24 n=1 Tax=Zea mays TaxID=4577 RepID=UPI0009A9D1F9|nr:probable inactive purple acid phosphatase 24 [Zea mays]|eukprot:XP_008647155.2 probable inactive purple acid phosphatase 24 [Zea mays]
MVRDPRRLYAHGRLYHIVERKPFRIKVFVSIIVLAFPVQVPINWTNDTLGHINVVYNPINKLPISNGSKSLTDRSDGAGSGRRWGILLAAAFTSASHVPAVLAWCVSSPQTTWRLVEWDFFLNLIAPVASRVPYMTAIGNHERDYVESGSVYVTPDSGGECGVAYESYFRMPAVSKDKPWYSIEQGSVHFVVMSTEHKWSEMSKQYKWMNQDLSSINRSRTPWIIFIGDRPMYSSHVGIPVNVDLTFVASVEPLLLKHQADLVFFGHVHNYERTCAIYKNRCKGKPKKDASGIDTYDNSKYTSPIHATVRARGFSLDKFPRIVLNKWSLSRVSEFGYARVHATRGDMLVQFVSSSTMEVLDQFRIVKPDPARRLRNKPV